MSAVAQASRALDGHAIAERDMARGKHESHPTFANERFDPVHAADQIALV